MIHVVAFTSKGVGVASVPKGGLTKEDSKYFDFKAYYLLIDWLTEKVPLAALLTAVNIPSLNMNTQQQQQQQ